MRWSADGDSRSEKLASFPLDGGSGGLCRVFVSYSHVDEAELARLKVHLAPLVREGLVDLWTNHATVPGSDWEQGIETELALADIVILLVTADFVASMYCVEKELAAAMRRHRDGGLRIVPVIVKPVDFGNLPFGRFQALPRDLRPVSTWCDADEAWLEVERGIRELVQDVYRSRTPIPAQRDGVDKSVLGQELRSYYGSDSCVVDGPVARDEGIEWIPLDGDSSAMRLDNLVPIGSRYRQRTLRFMTGTLQRATFRFGIDLVAENLFHSARRHFHAGVPALAYGCARLGDALAVHYPYAFETHEGDDWAFLAQSLFYLPYRMHGTLLDATLSRVRRRLDVSGGCPNTARAALLLAIGNLYQDIGSWTKAERLYDELLLSGPPEALRLAASRRRAVGRLFGDATSEMDREFRSISEYETNADLSVSLAISHGWWHLSRGRPEECLRRLESFDFDESAERAYSPHNAVELKLTQAAALVALGLSCGSQIRFAASRGSGGAHLRPVFTDHVASRVLARELDGVIEPYRGPAIITSARLDATAGALLAAKGTPLASRPIWVD